MTLKEYNEFVKQFNKWVDEENKKVQQAAKELGLTKPVEKELLLKLPTSAQMRKDGLRGKELKERAYEAYVLSKEQQQIMSIKRAERTEGVLKFINKQLGPVSANIFRTLSDYQIQALISRDYLPTYVPYINYERYTTDDVYRWMEDEGYELDDIMDVMEDLYNEVGGFAE